MDNVLDIAVQQEVAKQQAQRAKDNKQAEDTQTLLGFIDDFNDLSKHNNTLKLETVLKKLYAIQDDQLQARIVMKIPATPFFLKYLADMQHDECLKECKKGVDGTLRSAALNGSRQAKMSITNFYMVPEVVKYLESKGFNVREGTETDLIVDF